MANTPLSIPEKSALLALLMIGRTASNTEIRDLYGFTIEKAVRESLIDRKLIEAQQSKVHKNAWVHDLTEPGWKRCREQFADAPPPGVQRKDRLLYGLAQWVDIVFVKTGWELADVYAEPEPEPEPKTESTVDERIITAYHELVTDSGAWVGLAELRRALPDVGVPEFDAALHRIAEMPSVFFTPEMNQKLLTEADRRAAVRLGGEEKHLLSIKTS
ncbi:hypothetical protein LZG04_27900 [Saccharothrix sp. S26]|uniref:hypothetical protein n=1 Tax=Saccharothrix sp. S26 TaxID=2907215 RepID=UPI001F27323B|nr:hypothetical protein [Saccharothrix sp. S26]MCE6998594.1 hypothetical protein [Saccharothrix sp. S26]